MSLSPSSLTPRSPAGTWTVALRYRVAGSWFAWKAGARFPLSQLDEEQTKCLGTIGYVEKFAVTGAVWRQYDVAEQRKLLRFPANTSRPPHGSSPGAAA